MLQRFTRHLGVLAFCLLIAGQAAADDQTSVTQAKQSLQRQIDLLDSIKPYVERQDVARLYLLRTTTQEALDAINNKGPLSLITLHAYENLILKYRYSTVYFEEIATTSTEGAIKEIEAIGEAFAKQINFDDSAYNQITLHTYDQMYRLVLQLLQMTIPPKLHEGLEGLIPFLGEVKAKSQHGDDFNALQAATPCAAAIRQLYKLFYQVPTGDAAFNLVEEIQGLNDWYIEKTRIPVPPIQ